MINPMTVDPRHLAYLLAIYENGSLSNAAKLLGLSQPALSNAVALLERRLGAKVLNRNGRGVVVNEIGMILVRRSREMRSLLSGAEEEIRLKRNGQSGPLAIGATPSVVEHLLPRALRELQHGNSGLTISVVEGLDGSLNQLLLNGELDLVVGVVGQPFSPVELIEEVLIEDNFYLAVGPNHPLVTRESVHLNELSDHLWVMPRPGGAAFTHVQAIFLNAGVAWPTQTISTNSFALTRRMIGQSDAVGLVTAMTLAGWESQVRAIPMPEAGTRKVGVRQRRQAEISPLARGFLEILRDVAARQAREERIPRNLIR